MSAAPAKSVEGAQLLRHTPAGQQVCQQDPTPQLTDT